MQRIPRGSDARTQLRPLRLGDRRQGGRLLLRRRSARQPGARQRRAAPAVRHRGRRQDPVADALPLLWRSRPGEERRTRRIARLRGEQRGGVRLRSQLLLLRSHPAIGQGARNELDPQAFLLCRRLHGRYESAHPGAAAGERLPFAGAERSCHLRLHPLRLPQRQRGSRFATAARRRALRPETRRRTRPQLGALLERRQPGDRPCTPSRFHSGAGDLPAPSGEDRAQKRQDRHSVRPQRRGLAQHPLRRPHPARRKLAWLPAALGGGPLRRARADRPRLAGRTAGVLPPRRERTGRNRQRRRLPEIRRQRLETRTARIRSAPAGADADDRTRLRRRTPGADRRSRISDHLRAAARRLRFAAALHIAGHRGAAHRLSAESGGES